MTIHATTAPSLARRSLTLIGALLALAAPPVLLAVLIGNPLPHGVPTGRTVEAWLRSPLSDRAAVRLLAAAGWLTWLHLCACVVSEVVRQLRGRSWQVPLGGSTSGSRNISSPPSCSLDTE